MGHGFTSREQELGLVFSVAVCKIQASKSSRYHYYQKSINSARLFTLGCASGKQSSGAYLCLYYS